MEEWRWKCVCLSQSVCVCRRLGKMTKLELITLLTDLGFGGNTSVSIAEVRTLSSLRLSLSCLGFISQPGDYLNVIMTFAIKSKQRGLARGGAHARPPRFSMFLIYSALLLLFMTNDRWMLLCLSSSSFFFLKRQIVFIMAPTWSSLWMETHPSSVYIYCGPACVSARTTSYLPANSIPFA